ncbi:MAG: alginate lyase family protein [Planctomycetes bacterium]|nr:alginate lyase family protein [Planctomycetota bacterium]
MRRHPERLALVVAFVVVACLSTARAQQQARRNWRQVEQEIRAHNAALQPNGGRVGVELLSDDAGIDRNTGPEQIADGNTHSRCVLWGRYRVRIDLVEALPISQINFICSDGQVEASPRDLEVRLSDGTVLEKTLDVLRPDRSRRDEVPRQSLPIGRTIEWVEVTVTSAHPGAIDPNTGKARLWGGLGEIEVITTADLAPLLVVPDFNADAPTYIEGGSPRNDYGGTAVTLPTIIPLGTHPGIYLTREELVEMRRALLESPRAADMRARLLKECDAWLDRRIVHPDPSIPAQLRDRDDAQSQAHDLLSKMAGWLGYAYQLTDDERYAAKAREILVGYARLYPDGYQEHKGVNSSDTSKVMAQRLSEAMWLMPLIQAYDLIYQSPCLSDEDHQGIETGLIRCALTFINGKRSAAAEVARRDGENPNWRTDPPARRSGALGNWTNFYNAAYIQGGIALNDQNWIDIGAADTRHMIANGIGEDGMWAEGAIGYQLFARHALIGCLEPLARKGIDVYGFMNCRFKNLFDSPLKYAYPDGTAPGINDSGRAPVGSSWTAMAYDFAWLRYGDPNYGSIVNAAPRQLFQSTACYFPTVIYEPLPEKPMAGLGSLIFDALGYGILRGADGDGGTFLLMDYGPHGGVHGHPDKLNLILFADGDELAGEPAGYRYEDSLHAEWTRPTIAHWTMSVDEHSQAPAAGKLLVFYDAGDVKVIRGQAAGAYTGVALDRTVVQMPGYIVDIYRGWGRGTHTFDYPLCFRGTLGALAGADPDDLEPMGRPVQRGYKHIRCTRPVTTGADWTGTWRRDASTDGDDGPARPANEVKATVLGAPNTTIYTGVVPGDRHQAVLRRTGNEAIFATVVDPYRAADAVTAVEAMDLQGPVPACGLRITRADGGTDLVIVRYDGQTGGEPAAATTFEGGRTDALVTVIRFNADGTVRRIGMTGGTQAACGTAALALEAPGIVFSR